MRKFQVLGGLLIAVSLAATGCGVSGGPEKTFKDAANERLDYQLDLLEIADMYQDGDSEKAKESAKDWADNFNEFQAEYVCREERDPIDSDNLIKVIKQMSPSETPDEDYRDEFKEATKDVLKDLEKDDDDSTDDEAYIRSEHEDFGEVIGVSSVYMQKEDGDWKTCDDSLALGFGMLWKRL